MNFQRRTWCRTYATGMSQDSQTTSQLGQVVADIQRPHSVRSVASNSSIVSGVSLARRARTRTRAKTLTGATSSRVDGTLARPNTADLLYFDKGIVQEPGLITSLESMPAPQGPPRSPNRPESAALPGGNPSERGGDVLLGDATVLSDSADAKIVRYLVFIPCYSPLNALVLVQSSQTGTKPCGDIDDHSEHSGFTAN